MQKEINIISSDGEVIIKVRGDEWIAGNLSYHLKDRPKWELFLYGTEVTTGKKLFIGEIMIYSKKNVRIIPSELLKKD